MGKGSKARPFDVKYEDFANSWEKIFGKKDVKEEKHEQKKPEKDESKKTK